MSLETEIKELDKFARVLDFVRAGEMDAVDHRVLVWGASGTGKTSCAVLAAADMDVDLMAAARGSAAVVGDPSVFVLETERNALPTIRAVNPQAAVKLCQTKAEVWAVIQAAQSGQLRAAGFTRLVIDGLTEVQRLVADELDRTSDTYWNDLIARTRILFRTIRAIPMTVVATALEQSRENERTKVVHVAPQFEWKGAPDAAMETYSAVCRTTKEGEGDLQRYVADFRLPSRYAVKECGALGGRVKPCVAAWLDVLDGRLPYDDVRLAPREAEVPADPVQADAGGEAAAAPKPRAVRR